jgi:TonB-linked SusC/RagA family outer membrane protein
MYKKNYKCKIIFLTLFQIVFTWNTFAQTVTLSLENETFEKVLNSIKKQTGLSLVFSEQIVDLNRKVSIDVDSVLVEDALEQLLNGTNLSFEIKKNKLYFVEKSIVKKSSIESKDTPSKTKKISGVVTDVQGNPIIGASVTVNSLGTGTITDVNGNFHLDVPEQAVITISYMGYQETNVKIGSLNNLKITLEEDNNALDELVVMGYGTQRKVDLTGSVASISSTDIMRGQPISLEQALKGVVAGVQVQNTDGAPGGGITIKIRGANSITAGNAPLYVIDGFPVPVTDDPANNPLSLLSPESIENIAILKDVSSTAIYGAQGANGVILITTKKAKEGHSEFSVKASTGFSNLSKSLEMLNNEEYMKAIMLPAIMSQHWENTDFYEDYKNQIWRTDPSRFQSYQDICMRTGQQQKLNLSFLGGTSVLKNMTNMTILDNRGVVINSDYKNYNIVSNTTVQLLPKLSIDTNLSYEYNTTGGIGYINSIATFSPLIPKEWTFEDIDNNLYYTGKMDNPYRILTDTEQKRDKSMFSIQTELKWEILNGLNFKGGVGIRRSSQNFKKYVPPTILSSYNNEGEAHTAVDDGTNIRYSAQLNYIKTIKNTHEFSVGIAAEANSNKLEQFSQQYTHFNTDLGWYGIGAAQNGTFVTPPTVFYDMSAMLSGVVMGNYSFKSRYLLKASFRADGSSKFGSESRWGYFPSGAIGWRISEEPFFKSSSLSKYIDNVKLRISGGSVGNDQIDNYIYVNSLGVGSRNGVFVNASSPNPDGTYGSAMSGTVLANYTYRMSNPAIAWETTSEINYGLDLGLFKSRLNIAIDYYQKKTTNMLLNKSLPMVSGFNSVTKNIGSVGNNGIELGISGAIIERRDFSWDASFNIAANRSKVLDLGDGVDKMLENRYIGNANSIQNVLIQVGKPLGLLYGLQMEGIRGTWASDNNAANSLFWYSGQREAPYGFPSFADINGDGTVDLDDKTVIGCVFPSFIGGYNQVIRYKFIELAMNFSWSVGNDIVNGNYYDLANLSLLDNKLKVFYHSAWFANNGGTIPGPGGGDWSAQGKNAATPSEIVEDGSYLKMNNLSCGIALPKRFIPIKRLRLVKLTYSVTNLFTLTRYSGYDPEVSSGSNIDNRILSGVDLSAYPYSRTHLFTLNIHF